MVQAEDLEGLSREPARVVVAPVQLCPRQAKASRFDKIGIYQRKQAGFGFVDTPV
ncbi:hypothetical protein GCM10009832_22250 [Dietzia kunjamensis subsp. schimae]